MYEFECPGGHCATKIRDIERRDDQLRCEECGLEMDRQMSMPTVRTVATHMGRHKDFDGMGYTDWNLRDRNTGKPLYITSLDQKRNALKERGLEECGDDLSIPGAVKRRDDERNEGKNKVTFDAPRSTR
jgi:hypothetical protein